MLTNHSIRHKLLIAFFVIIVSLVILGYITYFSLEKLLSLSQSKIIIHLSLVILTSAIVLVPLLILFFSREIAQPIEKQLDYLVLYDKLTGLSNRNAFEIELTQALLKAQLQQASFSLLLIDVDNFKSINEFWGHDHGNQLLKEIAERLSDAVTKDHVLTRLGGDEFGVIINSTQQPTISTLFAKSILSVLKKPFRIQKDEVKVNISIGIAIYPQDGESINTLIRNAEIAMYHAKNSGGDQFKLADASMAAQNLLQAKIENYLKKALKNEEFQLNYQAQVDIYTGKIIGIEALLRWYNQEYGEISPSDFIPMAERLGLIIPIGEYVLRQACKQYRSWLDEGVIDETVKIAINLSSQQLLQKNLAEIITEILNSYHIKPESLELELTETALISDQNAAIHMLTQLNQLGISIAIDDFGTGYSSLSYLKNLPVSALKIDRSFVKDMTSQPHDATIVKAIIALGHALNLKVIAEGVEASDQVNYLRDQGCRQAQGYYFSKPLNTLEITQLLSYAKNPAKDNDYEQYQKPH